MDIRVKYPNRKSPSNRKSFVRIMSKTKKIFYFYALEWLRKWIWKRRTYYTTDGTILLCKICNIKVAAENKFSIQQHISKENHINILKLMKKENSKYSPLANTIIARKMFNFQFFNKIKIIYYLIICLVIIRLI